MYKRQHYALEHSERNSASSGSSSSSLDTASDADSGGPEHVDDAAWPASSHESDESSQEEEVVEVESSTSVAERRAEAIRIAERKLAEASEDVGEFGEGIESARKESELVKSGDQAAGSGAESSDESEDDLDHGSADQKNGTLAHKDDSPEESSDVERSEELLAQRKVSSQWAEAVEEDEVQRVLDRFEGNTVICIGDEKKILKCRLCPKVLCLKEETMQAHLVSKRHARSMKQLAEGKLKIQLDSDGEEEEEGETHAERYARTMAAAEELKVISRKRKRDSGRQRQRNREVVKKKAATKPDTAVPAVVGKNRKERRAIVHGDLNESKSATSTKPKGKVKDISSRIVSEKKEAIRKNRRPRHT